MFDGALHTHSTHTNRYCGIFTGTHIDIIYNYVYKESFTTYCQAHLISQNILVTSRSEAVRWLSRRLAELTACSAQDIVLPRALDDAAS